MKKSSKKSFKKKPKIKEIKSSKRIKEISEEKKEEENLEEITEGVEISSGRMVREIKSSPVLDRVAEDRGVLWTRTPGTLRAETEENEEIKYKETESDYLTPERATANTIALNDYRENAPDYMSMIPQEKAIKDMRRIMERTGERVTPHGNRNSWERIETAGFVEPDDKTRKYIGKGDMK